MQIECGMLRHALKNLVRLLPKRQTMPTLEHVLFEPTENGVAFVATDLTTEVRVAVPAEAPFAVLMPARELLDFVRSIEPETMVRFEQLDKIVRVTAAGSTLELPPLLPRDFPKTFAHTSTGDTVCVTDSHGFLDALEWALLAVGHDPTRPQLTGVLLEGDRVVAVDGHRLHVATVAMRDCPRALVAAEAAAFVARALRGQSFEIGVAGDKTVRFQSATWTITTKQVDAKFPAYEQVIPPADRAAFHMDVDAVALVKALSRVARPGNTRAERPVRIRANGVIAIESMAADTKLATSVDVIESTHEGADHVQGFNAKYLANAITNGGETATLSFGRAEDPVRIDLGDERIAVVMPMRI